MKVREMIQKLKELDRQGWGGLEVAVLIRDKTYGPQHRGVLIKNIEFADIGGWGNYTIYIEPGEVLESIHDKKSTKKSSKTKT